MPAADLPRPSPASSPARDVAGLLGALSPDPTPRLTWYGPDGARVELSGRVLVTWVAKTAHQLLEEADLEPGGSVRLELGTDWRAPVFWLAASYLGARVQDGATDPGPPPDVVVVREGSRAQPGGSVVVVVPGSPLPGPSTDLPAGAVDHGEVSHFPDVLPAPGPRMAVPEGPGGGRVLRGPGTPSAELVPVWASGGSVVLHTGLDAERLAVVARQERVTAG